MKASALSFLILGLVSPLFAFAKTPDSCAAASIPVAISLTSELTSTVPSASIGFYTEMQNTGSEIISDASLAIEVVRKDTGTVIDRFVTPQPVAMLANSSGKVGFVWQVPSGVDSGVYTLMVTFVPKDGSRARAFAQGYPTASREITISGGAAVPAQIRSLTVNGNPYSEHTVARVAEKARVTATAATGNGIQGPYKGAIRWRLYAPDATLFDEPLDSREASVQLHPEQSANISYNLPTLPLGSYYLEGELSDGRSASYFDVLLAREEGAFAWTKCLTNSPASNGRSGNTVIVLLLIAAVIAIGAVWEFLKHRA